MAELPKECLPPKEYLPEIVRLLPEIDYPERFNLADVLLDENVKVRGDKVVIYYEDQRFTFREIQAMVNRFANALRELGWRKKSWCPKRLSA